MSLDYECGECGGDPNFEFSKDLEINVEAEVSLEWETDVEVNKDVDITVDVDSSVDLDGNYAELNTDVQAIGDNTLVEADAFVMTVEDELSSITLTAISAAE